METNKIFKIIGVLVLVGIGAYYAVWNKSSSQPAAPAPQTETTSVPSSPSTVIPAVPVSKTPAPQTATVEIKNFAFNLATLTIKAGTKVMWTNNDGAPHTITSNTGNLLNSDTLAPGQSFSFTFTSAGTVAYHCSIHPGMQGKIIVE